MNHQAKRALSLPLRLLVIQCDWEARADEEKAPVRYMAHKPGTLTFCSDKFAEVQPAFENVIRLNPERFEAHGSLGIIYLQKEDLDPAESLFRAALRFIPADEVARGYLDLISNTRSRSKPRRARRRGCALAFGVGRKSSR